MEAIKRRFWNSKSPLLPNLYQVSGTSISKGIEGENTRHSVALPPFISIVFSPGRPVLSVPEG